MYRSMYRSMYALYMDLYMDLYMLACGNHIQEACNMGVVAWGKEWVVEVQTSITVAFASNVSAYNASAKLLCLLALVNIWSDMDVDLSHIEKFIGGHVGTLAKVFL